MRDFEKYGILCQKSTFFKNGEFLKNTEFFEKHGILCQKSTFFKNGEFLKNTEFCVKSRLFEKVVIFHTYRVHKSG